MFKSKNAFGDASDSSVEKILYGLNFDEPLNNVKRLFVLKTKEAPKESLMKEAVDEVDAILPNKTGIKLVDGKNATMESAEAADENIQSKIEAFKKLNYYGHASDSSIQKLMYNENEKTMPVVRREKKAVVENDKAKTAQESLYEQYRLSQDERRRNRLRNKEDMNGTSLLLDSSKPAFRTSMEMRKRTMRDEKEEEAAEVSEF